MERFLVQPKKPYQLDTIRPIILGGTDANTPSGAVANLGGISKTRIGQSNGIAPLDQNNKIPAEFFPRLTGGIEPALLGPTQLYTGQSYDFIINNYDTLQTYDIFIDRGTVSRDKDVITLETSTSVGSMVLTINGKQYTFNVLAPMLSIPHLIFPLNNALNVSVNLTLQASPFTPLGTVDTHLSTSWQIAKDAAFTDIVFESLVDTNSTHFSQIQLPKLTISTIYYARVKYVGAALGETEWSNPLSFTTTSTSIPVNEVAQLHSFDGPLTNGITGYQTNYFGSSIVDISRDGTVIVTSDRRAWANGPNTDVGRVFIYNFDGNNWYQNSIQSNILDHYFNLGVQVAISADKQKIITVATVVSNDFPSATGFNGELRIYQTVTPNDYSSLTLVATYIPPTSTTLSGAIGTDIATTSNFETIALSAYNECVYIFNFDGNAITLSDTINNPSSGDGFGKTITLDDLGTTLVVGQKYAPGNLTNSTGLIRIYTFSNDVWTLSQSFGPDTDDPVIFEKWFGWPVKISPNGTKIATFSNTQVDNTGHVYLFEKVNNVWTQTKKLDLPEMRDDVPEGLGGEATSLCFNGDGSLLLLGSAWQSTPVSVLINGSWDDTGMCYLFDTTTPEITLVQTYIASDATNGVDGEDYGTQVAISYDGSTIVITAPYRYWNPGNNNIFGTVYVYK